VDTLYLLLGKETQNITTEKNISNHILKKTYFKRRQVDWIAVKNSWYRTYLEEKQKINLT
jgi:hypothetical protein